MVKSSGSKAMRISPGRSSLSQLLEYIGHIELGSKPFALNRGVKCPKCMTCIKIDLFESRQCTWCEWVFFFCSCTLSNAWWGCYLLVSWVALCANSRQQLAAVRSQQEERESTQLWKTLSRFYKLDLADGVDGGSGQARRKLRGKLAFVDQLSGMTTMVAPC